MNNTEAKIKELGLPIHVDFNENENEYIAYIEPCGFNSEKAAYNWIAKEFNLDNLVSKDKVIEVLKEIAEGKGSFSLDNHEHAKNTIRDMKELANDAIKLFEGE